MARPDADQSEPPTASTPSGVSALDTSPISTGPVTPRSHASDATELDLKPPGSGSDPAHRSPGDPDTMISAPRPAEQDDLEIRQHVRLLEDRIDDLEARVRMVEQRRTEAPLGRAQPWWIWLIFLVGLAITWRLLQALR
jgi:hypothetical protein